MCDLDQWQDYVEWGQAHCKKQNKHKSWQTLLIYKVNCLCYENIYIIFQPSETLFLLYFLKYAEYSCYQNEMFSMYLIHAFIRIHCTYIHTTIMIEIKAVPNCLSFHIPLY